MKSFLIVLSLLSSYSALAEYQALIKVATCDAEEGIIYSVMAPSKKLDGKKGFGLLVRGYEKEIGTVVLSGVESAYTGALVLTEDAMRFESIAKIEDENDPTAGVTVTLDVTFDENNIGKGTFSAVERSQYLGASMVFPVPLSNCEYKSI